LHIYSDEPYCDIQGGFTGTGNINVDPLFIRNPGPGADGKWGTGDDDYGDLRLQAGSPCIDAGSNAAVPAGATTDLAGQPRIVDFAGVKAPGAIVDMGAYETVLTPFAGGPYTVVQGNGLVLAASAFSAAAGALSYAWDWDADGLFDDATGPSPLFVSAGRPLGTVPITLRVTDAAGRWAIDNTTITVLSSIIYVDASAAGRNNGSSWADAYTNLTAALSKATAGQTIRVADGTYKPTTGADRSATFTLKNRIIVLGGYAGFGAANPDERDWALYPAMLSGDIGTAGSSSDNCYHVVTCNGAAAFFEGFVITAGNANGSSPNDSGGGMYLSSGAATIRNCIFRGNLASSYGGGMYCSASSPTLVNCVFAGNLAGSGGAIYNTSFPMKPRPLAV
jgi:hypothetical protein